MAKNPVHLGGFGGESPLRVALAPEEVTLPNLSAVQRCVMCPEHAQRCEGSSVHMEPGLGQCLDVAILWQFCSRRQCISSGTRHVYQLIVEFASSLVALSDETGVMLELAKISRSLHCPNALACPGGMLSDVETENIPMCSKGALGVLTWWPQGSRCWKRRHGRKGRNGLES